MIWRLSRGETDCELALPNQSRAMCAALAENDIDFSVLNDLTDQDLEKIGVTIARTPSKVFTSNISSRDSQSEKPTLASSPDTQSADFAERHSRRERESLVCSQSRQPVLPMTPGVPECRTHSYVRHGTSPFAAQPALTSQPAAPCRFLRLGRLAVGTCEP
jgi:hypothetical protein